jgi:carbon starvation protein
MRQLDRREDAPVVSFGGAMVSGALGVVVLVVLCAGFAEPAEWISFYGTLPAHADLYIWLDLAITKMGRFMAALGLSLHFAVAAVAAVVACMALGLLENTLRALSFGVEELAEDFSLERFKGRDRRARVTAVLIAASVFCALQVDLGLKHWLFLGLISQLFAGSILLLLSLVLYKHAKGMLFTLLPASFAMVIGFSGVYWFFTGGWYAGHWVLILATSCAGVLAATSVLACIGAFLKIRQRGAFPASPGMR